MKIYPTLEQINEIKGYGREKNGTKGRFALLTWDTPQPPNFVIPRFSRGKLPIIPKDKEQLLLPPLHITRIIFNDGEVGLRFKVPPPPIWFGVIKQIEQVSKLVQGWDVPVRLPKQ